MIKKFWNKARRASILSLLFLLLGLLINPNFLVLVIFVYVGPLMAGNIKFLEDSFVGNLNRETLIKITLLFASTLLAFDYSGGGLVFLIFAIIPIIWVSLTNKKIFDKTSEESSTKNEGEVKINKEEKEDKKSKLIRESSQIEAKEIRKNKEEESEKTNISQNNPKSKDELLSHLITIIEGEIYPKIEKRLSELIDLTITKRYFEDLKFVDDPELIFNNPTSFDFSKHEFPSSNSLYVWIHEYLKQNNLYKKFLTQDQLKKAEDVPFGKIYFPGKEESYGFLDTTISNLHLHCLVVIVREGLKCGANVDESRKYLEEIGIDELLEEIKLLEESNMNNQIQVEKNLKDSNDEEELKKEKSTFGFVKTEKEILFLPIKPSSNSYQFQEKTISLDQIDKWMFNKITEKILEDGGLEQFISFDETPDGGCFQNELLTWIINEGKSYEIFGIFNNNERKKLDDLLSKCFNEGGGFRPTQILNMEGNENEDDYFLAEQGESIINNLESNGIIFAAGFAAENNMVLDLIYEAWNENGWKDEINALKLFSQKKSTQLKESSNNSLENANSAICIEFSGGAILYNFFETEKWIDKNLEDEKTLLEMSDEILIEFNKFFVDPLKNAVSHLGLEEDILNKIEFPLMNINNQGYLVNFTNLKEMDFEWISLRDLIASKNGTKARKLILEMATTEDEFYIRIPSKLKDITIADGGNFSEVIKMDPRIYFCKKINSGFKITDNCWSDGELDSGILGGYGGDYTKYLDNLDKTVFEGML